MKHVQAIEYRNKTDPPTEDGWYYARWSSLPKMNPVPFNYNALKKVVKEPGTLNDFGIDDFDWFGPVRIVKEG